MRLLEFYEKKDNRLKKVPVVFDSRELTSRGGLHIFQYFLDRIGLNRKLEQNISLNLRTKQKINNKPIVDRIYSLILMLVGGCFRMYQSDHLKEDPQFDLVKTGIFKFAATTLSRTLKKFQDQHIAELHNVFKQITKTILIGIKQIVIDVDSSVSEVYGNHEGAAKGYCPKKKGLKSYHPLLAFMSGSGFLLNGILRSGNCNTANGVIPFLKDLLSNLPANLKRITLRFDCGFFSGELMDFLEDNIKPLFYVVKVKLRNMINVLGISHIKNWVKIGPGASVSEIVYQAGSWKKPRRIIVLRREIKYTKKKDGCLFDHWGYEYQCYATNLCWKPKSIVKFYNKRAECENYIKDFKYGYGWGKMLTSSFNANKVIFLTTMLTYNLTKVFQVECMEENVRNQTLLRLREKYIFQAARITKTGGQKKIHFSISSPLKRVYKLLEAS